VGSTNAGAAGLAHYTTRVDQTKESEETSAVVNIGLHYVATANATNALPKDSDGDGIPDFVEDANGNGTLDDNETDPAATTIEPANPLSADFPSVSRPQTSASSPAA